MWFDIITFDTVIIIVKLVEILLDVSEIENKFHFIANLLLNIAPSLLIQVGKDCLIRRLSSYRVKVKNSKMYHY